MNFAGRLSLGGARRNWGSAYIISPLAEKGKMAPAAGDGLPAFFCRTAALALPRGINMPTAHGIIRLEGRPDGKKRKPQ